MATVADDAVLAKIEFIEDNIRRTDLRHASVKTALSKARIALEHAKRAVDCLSAEDESLGASRLALTKELSDQRTARKRALQEAKTARVTTILTHFPLELLRSIFLEATNCVEEVWPECNSWSWQFQTEHTIRPFTLAAVNRRWREVALDTPGIWTLLGVDALHDKDSSVDLAYVKRLLTRSRGQPLDILLHWSESEWQSSEDYKNILDAVMRHVHRLRRASVALPSDTPEDALHVLRLPMPRLEFFHLHGEEMFPRSVSSSTYFLFCPRLRRFQNSVLFAVPRPPMVDLAYLDIQTDDTAVGAVWAMLRTTPSIEELHLKFHSEAGIGLAGPAEPLSLPNLVEIGLYGYYESFVPWVLSLQMPRLRTVNILGFHAADLLSPMFDKVASTATTLIVYDDSLDGSFMTPDDIPNVQKLRQLQHFILREPTVIGPHIASIFSSRDAAGLPLLESITIEAANLDDEQAAHVSNLMQALHARAACGADGAISFKLVADEENVPAWLRRQYEFITGDSGDGDNGDSGSDGSPVGDDAHSASGSESEEAKFTDGDSSGKAYTSDSSYEDSDDDSEDVDEAVD